MHSSHLGISSLQERLGSHICNHSQPFVLFYHNGIIDISGVPLAAQTNVLLHAVFTTSATAFSKIK
jgi:hypothetical protein